MKEASVAEIKSRFSEYIARVAYTGERVVITKRNKPIAALVRLEDLHFLNRQEQSEGLASVVKKWKDFEQIAASVTNAYERRNRGKTRKVSL